MREHIYFLSSVLNSSSSSRSRPLLLGVVLAVFFSLLSSCGYNVLSKGVPTGFSAIHVALVENQTREPGLEDLLHQALVEELLLDRRVNIVPSDRAEVVLKTTITRFYLRPTAESGSRATQYEIQLDADFLLIERKNGKVLNKITGLRSPIRILFSIGSDMVAARTSQEQAEIRVSRELARELAKRVLLK